MELLPSIWRNSDCVRKIQSDIFEADVDSDG